MKQAETKTPSAAPAFMPVSPLAAIAIVVAIYFAATAAGQVIVSLIPPLAGWTDKQAQQWLEHSVSGQFIFVVAVETLTIVLLYMVMRMARQHRRAIGLIRPRLRDLGVTMLAYPPYFLLNAVASISANALLKVNLDQPQQTGFEHASDPAALVMTFASLVLLPPLVEEILMRGFLFTNLKNRISVVKAALVASVIFALAHLQWGSHAPLLWAAAIDTFILSLVLCYLRHKTGSLWPGIGLHMLKNGMAYAVIFIFPRLHL